MIQLDEKANPEGQLRRAAGGSSTGTSTGAALTGTEDPLAGLNAATPGADLDEDGGLTVTTQSDGDSSNPSDSPDFVREAANSSDGLAGTITTTSSPSDAPGRSSDGGILLSLLVVVGAFIWGLSEAV